MFIPTPPSGWIRRISKSPVRLRPTVMKMTIDRLAAKLDAAKAMPMARREAFLAVPRHHFLPAQIWVDDEHGNPQPLSRDDNPDGWLAAAYRNVPILTQFDDGKTVWPDATGELCTSSASKPELMLRMLAVLDVSDGHHVLEIGTGTGYNAALLAARLGSSNVITVEIDPVLADHARAALRAIGIPVTVITRDGVHGYPHRAPYDRVILYGRHPGRRTAVLLDHPDPTRRSDRDPNADRLRRQCAFGALHCRRGRHRDR